MNTENNKMHLRCTRCSFSTFKKQCTGMQKLILCAFHHALTLWRKEFTVHWWWILHQEGSALVMMCYHALRCTSMLLGILLLGKYLLKRMLGLKILFLLWTHHKGSIWTLRQTHSCYCILSVHLSVPPPHSSDWTIGVNLALMPCATKPELFLTWQAIF